MKYKHINAAREARLWLTQVIVPTAIAVKTAQIVIPEVKPLVVNKVNSIKKKRLEKKIMKNSKKEERQTIQNENQKLADDLIERTLNDNYASMFNEETGEYWIKRLDI